MSTNKKAFKVSLLVALLSVSSIADVMAGQEVFGRPKPLTENSLSAGELAAMRARMAAYRHSEPPKAKGFLGSIRSAISGKGAGHDKQLANELLAARPRLLQEAATQDAALAEIRKTLQGKQLPASVLARHDGAVAKVQERRKELFALMDGLQASQSAGNDSARQRIIGQIADKLSQWDGHSSVSADFGNRRWGSPESRVRKPLESKNAFSLNLSMFGIKPLMVAGPVPAGVVLPVLPQLPSTTQAQDLAETEDVVLTAAIRAKAAELHNNPSEIYRWVHDNVEYIPTYGSIQGADYTLQTRKGNAFDTSSLLIALLRASGISARYVYGTIELPVANAMNWVGGVSSPDAALSLLAQGGIPSTSVVQGGTVTAVRLEHVWVEAFVDFVPSRGVVNKVADTWIPMDAAYKQYTYTAGINLQKAVPLDAQSLSADLKLTATVGESGWTQNIDQGRLQSALVNYQQQLQAYINQYYPNATLGDVLGKRIIQAYPGPLLSESLTAKLVAVAGDFQSLPDTMRHYARIKVYGGEASFAADSADITVRRSLPSLMGKALALSYVPSTSDDAATLRSFLPSTHADGTAILPSEWPASLPGYLINVSPQITIDGVKVAGSSVGQALGGNAFTRVAIESPEKDVVYADNQILAGQYHAFGVDAQGASTTQLNQIEARLVATRQKLTAGAMGSVTRQDLYGDLLNASLQGYFATNDVQDLVSARSAGMVSYRLPSIGSFSSTLRTQYSYGFPLSVSPGGVAADIDQMAWTVGDAANNANKIRSWNLAAGNRMSANAGRALEKSFRSASTASQAVSAVKVIQKAAQQGQKIYSISEANLTVVLPSLSLEELVKTGIQSAVKTGKLVLAPEGSASYAGWTGSAYVVLDPQTLSGYYVTRALSQDEVTMPEFTAYLSQGLGFEVTSSVPEGISALPGNLYDASISAATTDLTSVASHLEGCGGGQAKAMDCIAYPQGNYLQDALSLLSATATDLGSFNLSTVLLAGNDALSVSVQLSPESIKIGESTGIYLKVSGDTSGTVQYSATVNGVAIVLDANGTASFTPSAPGRYTVEASVTDSKDTARSVATLMVSDPSDTTVPEVSILSPVTSDKVTKPTPIMVTIRDVALREYLVAISPAGKKNYQIIAKGTQPVTNGQVALFDPTMLGNGQWDIVLQATDLNGLINSEKVTVVVKGDLKLGNFSFTVTDVEVPMAGIPIRVTRTYDTRRKGESLDFGYGWSVGYQDGKVEESRKPGTYWDLNEYRSGPMNSIIRYCVEPRGKPVVTVTLPGGQVETFEVTVTDPCHLYAPTIDGLSFTFTGVDNTLSTLEEEEPQPMRLNGGQLVDNGTYELRDPSLYKLTTKAGYIYHLDQAFGIRKIEDPNGNTLTYTANGIIHSSGLSVLFARDANGRINTITDPNGNVRRYSYDVDGNLAVAYELAAPSVTNSEKVSYTYYTEADGYAHYLREIRDALNRTVIKNIYDASGRLIAQEDNAGHRVEFSHNLGANSSVITNRRGYSTQYQYDNEGRILKQIDALGGITSNEYDARGNLLKKTKPNGEVNTATWSERNDPLTQTDGLGNTTTYSYNTRGQELSVTDARGNQYRMSYDTVGNLLTVVDPKGNVVGNMIGGKGLLMRTTNALNFSTQWTYDDKGRKLTETDALGNVTRYTYDDNGNVLTETRQRKVNGQTISEVTSFVYDSRNRVISTTDSQGSVTATEYDIAGRESARVDAKGRRTEMSYDVYGHLIKTTYPDGTSESSAYDAEGNRISSTDRLGRTTSYVYDALNRLIKTVTPD